MRVLTMKSIQPRETFARTCFGLALRTASSEFRFPVLVPPGLLPDKPQVEPDVIQIELSQEEERRFVSGLVLRMARAMAWP